MSRNEALAPELEVSKIVVSKIVRNATARREWLTKPPFDAAGSARLALED
jgi:hypothetical protein